MPTTGEEYNKHGKACRGHKLTAAGLVQGRTSGAFVGRSRLVTVTRTQHAHEELRVVARRRRLGRVAGERRAEPGREADEGQVLRHHWVHPVRGAVARCGRRRCRVFRSSLFGNLRVPSLEGVEARAARRREAQIGTYHSGHGNCWIVPWSLRGGGGRAVVLSGLQYAFCLGMKGSRSNADRLVKPAVLLALPQCGKSTSAISAL